MRLVGYARVSSITQAENTSLEDQKSRVLSYAHAMGHEIVEIYSEVGSGKNDERPEFQKAIAALKDGRADGIIAIKIDRLGRNVRDVLTLVDEVLTPLEKTMIVLDLGIDTATPAGRMVLTMMAAMAEMERSVILERTKRGRQAKADAGGYAYGSPQFGQKSVDRELVKDEAEQAVIEIIRKHRRSGKSPQAIADYLTSNNYPTKRGGMWQHTTVRGIIKRLQIA
ncbi:MAG: recombinase family protein [Phormidesmis sp. CAN_BIN44]|nr:recombinase family protein [Phormidesmis sp. CAN_BIN44]